MQSFSANLNRVAIFMVIMTLLPVTAGAEARLGAKGGISFASQDASGNMASGVERNVRTGLAAGAVLELSLSPGLWLRMEPMYIQKGAEIDWHGDFDEFDNTYELDYLLLPLNIKAGKNYGLISPSVFA